MSEPNERDKQVFERIVLPSGRVEHLAAYREEIEAKKTVPMAMLWELVTQGGYMQLGKYTITQIAARYGYEVTE